MHRNHEEYFDCRDCKTRIFISKTNGQLESTDLKWIKEHPCCKKAYADYMNPSAWKDYGK